MLNLSQKQRTLLRQLGMKTVKVIGNSRAKRNARGQWYLGEKLGMPPKRGVQSRNRNSAPAKKVQKLAKVVTKTVIPNAAQVVTNMQDPRTVRKIKTETIMNPVTIQTTDLITTDFGICYSNSANPADPGFTPSLSADATQYQQFRCRALKFTFKPSASATQNGQIYLAFLPNVTTAEPTSADAMQAILGCRQGPMFGEATVLTVESQCLQQAYNVQTVDKSKTTQDTPQVSPGRLVMGFSGVGQTFNTFPVGSLTVSYAYDFWTSTVTQGSNQIAGSYECPHGPTTTLRPSISTLTSGYHSLIATNVAGVFRPRVRGAKHFVVYRGTTSGAAHSTPAVASSQDGTTWTASTAVASVTNGANHVSAYILPVAAFYRFTVADALDASTLWVSSLPSGAF